MADSSNKYDISNSAYLQAYNQYAAQAQANYNSQVQYMDERATTDKNNAAQSYDSNARTAYINYLKQQNALNETLRNNGVNGGASETGYINVANNYARNQATNDSSRSASITSINNNYNDAKNELYSALQADLNASYLNAYSAAIQEMQNRQEQDKADFAATHTVGMYKNANAVQKAIDALDPTDPNYAYYKSVLQNVKGQVAVNAAAEKKKSTSKSSSTSKKTSTSSTGTKAVATTSSTKKTTTTSSTKKTSTSTTGTATKSRAQIQAEAIKYADGKSSVRYSAPWSQAYNAYMNSH